MGLYSAVSDLPELALVREAKSYTLYERGGVWYVNFRCAERQRRLSTGLRDEESARLAVEAHRRKDLGCESRQIDDAFLFRMIERARYRNKKKGVPFTITISDLREAAARCKGRCEVTGHPLEASGPFRPSLDRIEPGRGYVPGNVRIVCLITNTAMLHYGEAAFAEIAEAYCRITGRIAG
jgi:hypothetical protein